MYCNPTRFFFGFVYFALFSVSAFYFFININYIFTLSSHFVHISLLYSFYQLKESWFFQLQIKINFFIIAPVPQGIGALLILRRI